jgi:hypothetical protein
MEIIVSQNDDNNVNIMIILLLGCKRSCNCSDPFLI